MERRIIVVSAGMQEEHTLRDGVNTIGRESDNDVQLLTEGVSRHHASITSGPGVCILEDLNSANGTLVNGVSETERVLQHGDER